MYCCSLPLKDAILNNPTQTGESEQSVQKYRSKYNKHNYYYYYYYY